jgi:hypothetical protein
MLQLFGVDDADDAAEGVSLYLQGSCCPTPLALLQPAAASTWWVTNTYSGMSAAQDASKYHS